MTRILVVFVQLLFMAQRVLVLQESPMVPRPSAIIIGSIAHNQLLLDLEKVFEGSQRLGSQCWSSP